jgi:hypothetical protein
VQEQVTNPTCSSDKPVELVSRVRIPNVYDSTLGAPADDEPAARGHAATNFGTVALEVAGKKSCQTVDTIKKKYLYADFLFSYLNVSTVYGKGVVNVSDSTFVMNIRVCVCDAAYRKGNRVF